MSKLFQLITTPWEVCFTTVLLEDGALIVALPLETCPPAGFAKAGVAANARPTLRPMTDTELFNDVRPDRIMTSPYGCLHLPANRHRQRQGEEEAHRAAIGYFWVLWAHPPAICGCWG